MAVHRSVSYVAFHTSCATATRPLCLPDSSLSSIHTLPWESLPCALLLTHIPTALNGIVLSIPKTYWTLCDGAHEEDSLVCLSFSSPLVLSKYSFLTRCLRLGVVLLFAASILLLTTTISAPIINHAGLLRVDLANETARGHSSITFGTFGYCVLGVPPVE